MMAASFASAHVKTDPNHRDESYSRKLILNIIHIIYKRSRLTFQNVA